jgi:DNA-binding MarR family transcriptional regulator
MSLKGTATDDSVVPADLLLPPAGRARGGCDSVEQEAYLHLWRTFDRLRAVEEEVFDRHGLSAQQYNALRVLADVAPESLPTLSLAARLVSRAPDITRLVDRLERRRLVRRQRLAANRRVVRVSITAAGTELLAALAADVVDCGRRQLGHMPAADLEQLVRLLRAARAPHESRTAYSPDAGRPAAIRLAHEPRIPFDPDAGRPAAGLTAHEPSRGDSP